MMKICTICKQSKSESEYNLKRKSKDGLQSHCKNCNREASHSYYESNLVKHRKTVMANKEERRKRNQAFILDYYLSHPCVDCGFTHPAALQFDHIEGTKKKAVAHLVAGAYSIETLLEEISKCEVRCANCHFIRTAQQFNWFSRHAPLTQLAE